MKFAFCFLVLFPFWGYSQDDDLPDIAVCSGSDSTVLLFGYLKDTTAREDFLPVKDLADSMAYFLVDKYRFIIFIIEDSLVLPFIEHKVYLTKTSASAFLKLSEMIFPVTSYGYAPPGQSEVLIAKYGMKYEHAGCMYNPSEFERDYEKHVFKLLDIRNGKNWQMEYQKDKDNGL